VVDCVPRTGVIERILFEALRCISCRKEELPPLAPRVPKECEGNAAKDLVLGSLPSCDDRGVRRGVEQQAGWLALEVGSTVVELLGSNGLAMCTLDDLVWLELRPLAERIKVFCNLPRDRSGPGSK
jgi:hypothetical protein